MRKSSRHFRQYIERAKQLARDYYVDNLKKSKIKLTDISPEVLQFFVGTSAKSTGRLVTSLYFEYVEPLQKKLKKYLIITATSIIFLILCLVYIWATFNRSDFQVIILLLIPTLAGLSFSFIKGLKYWSEFKRNLAEAAKIKKEMT